MAETYGTEPGDPSRALRVGGVGERLTPEGARRAQRVQQRRTDARHAETRALLRQRARAQTQG